MKTIKSFEIRLNDVYSELEKIQAKLIELQVDLIAYNAIFQEDNLPSELDVTVIGRLSNNVSELLN